MLRFGLPTVPAEVSVFALFFIDRLWLYRFESAGRGRPVLALGQARRRRRVHRARVPVRLAAAGLLDRRRRRGGRVYARDHDLLRAVHRARRRRPGAARPLARAAVRRAGVLRGARGAALGRARLGAVRAVPRAGRDGRPRAGHRAQRPRRAVRAGGQRRAARAARPAARHRRRRPRAGRRLRRDAGRDVRADPQPVPGGVRVGRGWRCFVLVAGGDRGRGRAAAADRRRRRASSPARSRWRRSRPRSAPRASSGRASSRAARGLLRRRGPFNRRLNSSAASASPSPRSGRSVARDVLGVALRVVAGQDERAGGAQRVGPGGQPAHERRPRAAEWCLRM